MFFWRRSWGTLQKLVSGRQRWIPLVLLSCAPKEYVSTSYLRTGKKKNLTQVSCDYNCVCKIRQEPSSSLFHEFFCFFWTESRIISMARISQGPPWFHHECTYPSILAYQNNTKAKLASLLFQWFKK